VSAVAVHWIRIAVLTKAPPALVAVMAVADSSRPETIIPPGVEPFLVSKNTETACPNCGECSCKELAYWLPEVWSLLPNLLCARAKPLMAGLAVYGRVR